MALEGMKGDALKVVDRGVEVIANLRLAPCVPEDTESRLPVRGGYVQEGDLVPCRY